MSATEAATISLEIEFLLVLRTLSDKPSYLTTAVIEGKY